MDGNLKINSSSRPPSTNCPQVSCQFSHVITAVVGVIVLALGVVLKHYAGVNDWVMGGMIAAGSLIVIIDLFLARKSADQPVVKTNAAPHTTTNPPRATTIDPPKETIVPKVSKSSTIVGTKPKHSPSELLAIALDKGEINDVQRIINTYADKESLFKTPYDKKTPLQRALHNYIARQLPLDYNIIKALLDAGAPMSTGFIDGLSPFAFICNGIILKSFGEGIDSEQVDRRLLILLKPKDDAVLREDVRLMPKLNGGGMGLRLSDEKVFDFVKGLKDEPLAEDVSGSSDTSKEEDPPPPAVSPSSASAGASDNSSWKFLDYASAIPGRGSDYEALPYETPPAGAIVMPHLSDEEIAAVLALMPNDRVLFCYNKERGRVEALVADGQGRVEKKQFTNGKSLKALKRLISMEYGKGIDEPVNPNVKQIYLFSGPAKERKCESICTCQTLANAK